MEDFTRRLPVYLLLDCSGSMAGEPIEAVKQGVKALLSELRTDPQALETAYLSVITFSSVAAQIVPLTELVSFREPFLSAGGVTALGQAIKLLISCIHTEVRKASETEKGDWKPLVFLLTDGAPTDEWQEAARLFREENLANMIACAAGANADPKTLRELTDQVVMMNTLSAGELTQFFEWVSGSVKRSSKGMEYRPDGGIDLPPPPNGFTVVP